MPGIKAADTEEEERRLSGVKGLADVEKQRRDKLIKGQEDAEKIYMNLEQQRLISDKPTDFRSQVENYVRAEKYKIAHGQRKPIADELLYQEGDKAIQSAMTLARNTTAFATQQNANTNVTNAEINRDKEITSEYKIIVNEVNNQFNDVLTRASKGHPANIYATLQKAGKTEEAENFKKEYIKKQYGLLRSAGGNSQENPKPPAARLPNDIQQLVDKKYDKKYK